jgi:putative tricarboxylic transport membrane protein
VRRTLFVVAEGAPPPLAENEGEAGVAAQRFPWCLAGGVALTIAYVLALDWLGFFVSTVLYLALFMLVGRYRRARVIAAASVVGSLAFVFVFMKIVYVSLPLGRGPFKALSVWILAMLGVH